MSKKRILITGPARALARALLSLSRRTETEVIAGVQIWPQVTSLRQKVRLLGLSNLAVEKLDLLNPYDVGSALKWDIDILFSNAGIGENGPVCEIPVDRLISYASRFRDAICSRPCRTSDSVRTVVCKSPDSIQFCLGSSSRSSLEVSTP